MGVWNDRVYGIQGMLTSSNPTKTISVWKIPSKDLSVSYGASETYGEGMGCAFTKGLDSDDAGYVFEVKFYASSGLFTNVSESRMLFVNYPPSVPEELKVNQSSVDGQQVMSNGVQLSWDTVSHMGPDAYGYMIDIDRFSDPNWQNWTTNYTSGVLTSRVNYSVTLPYGSYRFRLMANDTNESSAWSDYMYFSVSSPSLTLLLNITSIVSSPPYNQTLRIDMYVSAPYGTDATIGRCEYGIYTGSGKQFRGQFQPGEDTSGNRWISTPPRCAYGDSSCSKSYGYATQWWLWGDYGASATVPTFYMDCYNNNSEIFSQNLTVPGTSENSCACLLSSCLSKECFMYPQSGDTGASYSGEVGWSFPFGAWEGYALKNNTWVSEWKTLNLDVFTPYRMTVLSNGNNTVTWKANESVIEADKYMIKQIFSNDASTGSVIFDLTTHFEYPVLVKLIDSQSKPSISLVWIRGRLYAMDKDFGSHLLGTVDTGEKYTYQILFDSNAQKFDINAYEWYNGTINSRWSYDDAPYYTLVGSSGMVRDIGISIGSALCNADSDCLNATDYKGTNTGSGAQATKWSYCWLNGADPTLTNTTFQKIMNSTQWIRPYWEKFIVNMSYSGWHRDNTTYQGFCQNYVTIDNIEAGISFGLGENITYTNTTNTTWEQGKASVNNWLTGALGSEYAGFFDFNVCDPPNTDSWCYWKVWTGGIGQVMIHFFQANVYLLFLIIALLIVAGFFYRTFQSPVRSG
jgi:hypothetical protein